MDPSIDWLLEGDISIQYLTRKYLLEEPEEDLIALRQRIATEGWGKTFLDARNSSGHWGRSFYQPKWISSHYTLLDLRNLEIEPVDPIRDTLQLILDECLGKDGSIHETVGLQRPGDICVNGMFLNYASFFGVPERELQSIVDYLLDNVLDDGGFNCESKSRPVHHSSLHSTLSVLEGLHEFRKAGYDYRAQEIDLAKKAAEAFILQHRLYKSDKTGEVISARMTLLSFPSRWHYDILRSLVYFADAKVAYDPRMADALEILLAKRRADGTWPLQAKHPGAVHFEMEQPRAPSRINTLRALRVLKAYGENADEPALTNP